MAFTLPPIADMRVLLFISGVLSVILALVVAFRNFGDQAPHSAAVAMDECRLGRPRLLDRGRGDGLIGAARSGLVRRSWRLVSNGRRCSARLAVGFDRCAYPHL